MDYKDKINKVKCALENIRIKTKDQHVKISLTKILNFYKIYNVKAFIKTLEEYKFLSIVKKGKQYSYYWTYDKPMDYYIYQFVYLKYLDNKDNKNNTKKTKTKKTKNELIEKTIKNTTIKSLNNFADYHFLSNFIHNCVNKKIHNSVSNELAIYSLDSVYGTAMKKANMFSILEKNCFNLKAELKTEHAILAIRHYWQKDKQILDINDYKFIYDEIMKKEIKTDETVTTADANDLSLNDLYDKLNNKFKCIYKELDNLESKRHKLHKEAKEIQNAKNKLEEAYNTASKF